MSDQLQPLTVNDVERVASAQLASREYTTTLDIKNELRKQGIFALQEDVAHSMYLLWESHGWHWTFNGTYRKYYPSLTEAENAYQSNPGNVDQTSWLGWLSVQAMQDYLGKQLANLSQTALGGGQQASAALDGIAAMATQQHSRIAPRLTANPKTGDWLVFDYKTGAPSIFVGGELPDDYEKARTAVRTFYSREYNVPREQVGAHKVNS